MAWSRRKLKPGIVTAPEIHRVWCVTCADPCARATANHPPYFLTISLSRASSLRLHANYLHFVVRTMLFAPSNSFATRLFICMVVKSVRHSLLFEQSIFSGGRLQIFYDWFGLMSLKRRWI